MRDGIVLEFKEPTENDDISCHLQQVGMGNLICKAARQTGDGTTNETTPELCFSCPAGKIYREIGCDAVTPKIKLYSRYNDIQVDFDALFCRIRKRETSLNYCKTCGLAVAETTRQILTNARGLFQTQKFYSAYQDLEHAREAIRDGNFENAVTRSISCLESTMHICHEKLGVPLPNKKQVSDLWKSTRVILKFDDIDTTGATENLLNSLTGVVIHLGGLRNSLGDAHGRGLIRPEISESIAEIALNTASTLATMIVRRFNQLGSEINE